MRRLRRILLLGSTALGLLLCIAVVALWARSRTVVVERIIVARQDGMVCNLFVDFSEQSVRATVVEAFPHPAVAERGHILVQKALAHYGHAYYVDVRGAEHVFDHLGVHYSSRFGTPELADAELIVDQVRVRNRAVGPRPVLERSLTLHFGALFTIGLTVAFLPWSLPLLGAVRRRRRRLTGKCFACGYDLRASPARCPECGAVREEARP